MDQKHGDLLTVDLTPYDGKAEGPIYRTKAVPMGNALPQLTSIALEPREVRVGDMVQAKVNGSDADEDQIMYRFRWLRNNEEVMEGEKSVLDTTGFSRGDVVTVQVTPYDNEGGKGKACLPSRSPLPIVLQKLRRCLQQPFKEDDMSIP